MAMNPTHVVGPSLECPPDINPPKAESFSHAMICTNFPTQSNRANKTVFGMVQTGFTLNPFFLSNEIIPLPPDK